MRARPRRTAWTLAAAAALALAACTPAPVPAPTATADDPSTSAAPLGPTLDPLLPLDPPLDPGAGPTEPDDGAPDGSVLTWTDGMPAAVVPLDPGLAVRLDTDRLRTVARPDAADGHELDMLGLGDDGSALVADGTLSGDVDIAATRTTRLRFEGPAGVRELDLGPGAGRLYGGRVLDDGSVVAWGFTGDEAATDTFVRFRAGERRGESFQPDDRFILGTGLLAPDGTLTAWDGTERATGVRTTGSTTVVEGGRCGDDCYWSVRTHDTGDGGTEGAARQSAEIARTVGGTTEVLVRSRAEVMLVGADGDHVVLQYFPSDASAWEVVVLDVAARTATSVSGVARAAFADGRLAWTRSDPYAWGDGGDAARSGDVHVLDVRSGALARIPQPSLVLDVLVAGEHVAWTLGGTSVEDPGTRGVVARLTGADLAG